jgi:hypothetical protein
MPTSSFNELTTIADALDRVVRDLEPSPLRDTLAGLLTRLDGVIDDMAALPEVHQPAPTRDLQDAQRCAVCARGARVTGFLTRWDALVVCAACLLSHEATIAAILADWQASS